MITNKLIFLLFPSWLHERDYTAITHFSGVLCFISTDGNVSHMVVRRHKTSGSREESFMCRFWCVSFSTLCLSWDQRGGNHSFLLRLAWVRYYSVASVCSVNCFSFYLSWTELSDGLKFWYFSTKWLENWRLFPAELKVPQRNFFGHKDTWGQTSLTQTQQRPNIFTKRGNSRRHHPVVRHSNLMQGSRKEW